MSATDPQGDYPFPVTENHRLWVCPVCMQTKSTIPQLNRRPGEVYPRERCQSCAEPGQEPGAGEVTVTVSDEESRSLHPRYAQSVLAGYAETRGRALNKLEAAIKEAERMADPKTSGPDPA